ncbi:MAG: GNAT family N-acetyltransferase [Clostridia bacterium]
MEKLNKSLENEVLDEVKEDRMLQCITDKLKWEAIVGKFCKADIYYTFSYLQAFKLHGDGEPILFFYSDDDVQAINAVMLRDISLDKNFKNEICENKFYDLATPYGYGGWLFEGKINDNSLEKLKQQYVAYCEQNNIISEFVRFHPLLNNASAVNNIYEIVDLGNTIAIDLTNKEDIWDNVSSKNRNVIRKAIKSGVIIGKSQDDLIIDSFKTIYNATMDRDNADDYYYFGNAFYESIKEGLKNNFTIYYAKMDNKIIGAAIILFYGEYVHYHLSGAIKEYMSFAPMNLLLYKVACDFSELGYKKFHLGGGVGSDSNSGLYKFKENFNKNGVNHFSIGKKIFIQTKYDELIERRKNDGKNFDENSSFFPKYRG